MTPYERLMAEAIPTGRFGYPPPLKPQERPTRPWTPEEQAQHLADLTAALDGWQDHSERATRDRDRHRPHLRLIQPDQTTDAA